MIAFDHTLEYKTIIFQKRVKEREI